MRYGGWVLVVAIGRIAVPVVAFTSSPVSGGNGSVGVVGKRGIRFNS